MILSRKRLLNFLIGCIIGFVALLFTKSMSHLINGEVFHITLSSAIVSTIAGGLFFGLFLKK